MRALPLAALWALAACGLVTPFSAFPPGDGGSAADADADADGGDGALDGDLDADDDGPDGADAEVEPFHPLEVCTGARGPERWLVASWNGLRHRGYVTGRDCAEPVEICVDCVPTSLSPSGDRALVVRPESIGWRLEDEIAVIDLTTSPPRLDSLGVTGALPVWADDSSFYFVDSSADGPCSGAADRDVETVLLRFDLESGDLAQVGAPTSAGWRTGFPAPSPAGDAPRRVAYGFDAAGGCDAYSLSVAIRDVDGGSDHVLGWTVGSKADYPVGVLPSGEGFLVQTLLNNQLDASRIYAVRFDGATVPVLDEVPSGLGRFLFGDSFVGEWPDCGSVRRLGPACELYCIDFESRGWTRHDLRTGEATPVDCTLPAGTPRIMDVWQR